MWLVKMIGKRIDADLTKWGISKTKVIAWIGVLVVIVQKVGPLLGHPVVIPPDVFKLLEALGLWALRDGMDQNVAA